MDELNELLDLMEDRLVVCVKDIIMTGVGKAVTDEQARAVIAKVGTRLMFADSIGKNKVTELFIPSK